MPPVTPARSRDVEVMPFTPPQLRALLGGEQAFAQQFGFRVAPGISDFVRAGSAEYRARFATASTPDPWRDGFAILHCLENTIIGTCGFRSPPGADRSVEIGYGIVESHRGRGYATAAAAALIDWASKQEDVRTIIAHTLPEENASTSVLTKLGFRRIGEVVDPEDGPVWRWQLELSTPEGAQRVRPS